MSTTNNCEHCGWTITGDAVCCETGTSSGLHLPVIHQRSMVCDTCTNTLGINIRWDQAPCRRERTSAPKTRTVCMLTGEKAARPSAFFSALNEATQRVTDAESQAAELARLREENRELNTRVEELGAELDTQASAFADAVAKGCGL